MSDLPLTAEPSTTDANKGLEQWSVPGPFKVIRPVTSANHLILSGANQQIGSGARYGNGNGTALAWPHFA
jgi:hypothetical protein